MQNMIENVNKQCGRISNVAYVLHSYADAFATTGMEKVSKDLQELSEDLTESGNIIRQSVSKELDRQCKQADLSSATMLNAALAGIHVAHGTKDITATGRKKSQPAIQTLNPIIRTIEKIKEKI